jgi:hypothetical protein
MICPFEFCDWTIELYCVVRRYNAILYVPYQLERLIWYQLLVCLDTFLVRLRSASVNQDCQEGSSLQH